MKSWFPAALLALVWGFLTGWFAPLNLLFGLLLGRAVLSFVRLAPLGEGEVFSLARLPARLARFVLFVPFFLYELVLANLRVAYDVLTPRHRSRPGILEVPLDARSDEEIAMLANLITLTPGTLSLDVSEDRRSLFVHSMFIDDAEAEIRAIKEGFERRVLGIWR